MSLRLHAEPTASGIVLDEIKTAHDAESICNFFRQKGQPASVAPDSVPGDFRVIVLGLEWVWFRKLIEGANIELI